MSNSMSGSNFSDFRSRPRKAVRLSQEELVRTGYLPGDADRFPLVIEPNVENINLTTWAGANRALIEERLLRHGAILFRGFGVGSAEHFHEVSRALYPELLDYKERAAPRNEVSKKVYTSTEFPADQYIPLHHEMSYSHNWPTKIFFYCDQPARKGGCTPITDDRKVVDRIDPEVRQRFLEKKVMYVRNYGEGVDLSWREAFQTDDRAVVEEYCRKAGATVEWRDDDRLRTRSVRQVMVEHPQTGDKIWFNHAHMFHVSNLQPAVRESLLSEFAPDELPRNAFYGDGTPIEDAVLEHIRQVYQDTAVAFPWEKGDVLLVDNILASHGREPFEGPRTVLVAMADLYTHPGL
jgi:alpha-ketoglutarate-dependent taurine dioxygenase